jgi:sulfite exporter TauE/SafE
LAAIAPLAVRNARRAWIAGLRWGLGHSAGVCLVGVLSLWLRDLLPLDLISSWGERLVAVVLFAIGLWALRLAARRNIHTHEHEHEGLRHIHFHSHDAAEPHAKPRAHEHRHAAFGIGVLHGLAGSSHFLGVLPMLAFPTQAQAIAYLLAFAVGTIASMAGFSWVMGWVASRCSARGVSIYRGLLGFSAVAAMVVGVFWLTASFH